MVGAVSAFASNFFYGQGPFAPWQMFAYGAGGMLAGFCFRKNWLPRKNWVMAVFGFCTVLLWMGPLLDSSHLFLMMPKITWTAIVTVLVSGFYVNVSQAICTALILFLLGNAILEKLDRVKIKYGLIEN
jgi:energy-coupling factor transport system substrate-specific component